MVSTQVMKKYRFVFQPITPDDSACQMRIVVYIHSTNLGDATAAAREKIGSYILKSIKWLLVDWKITTQDSSD